MASVGPVRPPIPLLEALVRAAATPGVGRGRLRAAVATREHAPARLAAVRRRAEAELDPAQRERAAGWAVRALATIRREALHVLLPSDSQYPPALLNLPEPPCPLFARGRLDLLEEPMVAVVGTRRASPVGLDTARRIAAGIAAAGVNVISGLATGIDGQAHTAAGPGRTVAVLGCGIDVVYPRHHGALQAAIGREGLLLSEHLPGTPPAKHHFPLRNRVIAALARGVVVVEAPEKSGALSTAKRARDQGVDVFAVPGSIRDARSAGSNALIRDGARLVTSAREVLDALGLPLPPEGFELELPPSGIEGQGLALWRTLGADPLHVDEIASRTGLAPHLTLASLLSLEVQGHARQLPGMRFTRRAS